MSDKLFELEVYGAEETDYPDRLTVIITPQRAAEIRRMAEIVRAYETHNVWYIAAWDYSPNWYGYAGDSDDTGRVYDDVTGDPIRDGEPQRMECCAIRVGADEFSYEAYVKNCDILCETDRIRLSDLPDQGPPLTIAMEHLTVTIL